MDSTRQNLLRVNDVLGEIQKQINSLRYQAQKLKRFKGIKDRIRTLDLALASQHYRVLYENKSLKETDLGAFKDKQSRLMTEINSLNAANVTKKIHLQENEDKFTATQGKKLEIEYSLREEENRIERWKEKINDLEKQRQTATRETEENVTRLQTEEEEINRSKTLLNQLQEEREKIERRLKEEEKELSRLKENFAEIRNDIEHGRGELFEVRNEINRRDTIIDRGEQTLNECQRRLEQNREENRSAQAQVEELKGHLLSITEELDINCQEKELVEQKEKSLLETISRLENEIKDIIDVLAASKEQQARCESQLESLQELRKTFEGCSDGVRSIMLRKDVSGKIRNGIFGLVADFIETEPRLETAVEAVLGEKLQYVIVKSHVEGIEAIEHLKAQSLGRGSFLPVENKKPFVFDDLKSTFASSQAIPLINMVKVKKEYQPFIRYLLEDTLLVENLSQALALWKQNNLKTTLVTLDGEIIDPMGIITGGVQNGSGSGLLRKKREIKELENNLASLTKEVTILQQKKEEKVRALEDNQKSLKNIQDRIIQLKLFLQNKERDYHQNTEETQRIQRKIEFLSLEEKKLINELEEIEEDLEKNHYELDELHSEQLRLEEIFSVLQRKEMECQSKIEGMEKSLDQDKIEHADVRAKISSLTSALSLREKAIESCRVEISKYTQAKEEAEKKSAEVKRNIETASLRVNDMSKVYQRYQDELRDQENKLNEVRYDLSTNEDKLKAIQGEFNDLQPLIQKLDHELAEFMAKTQFLEKTIEEKYHVVLSEVENQFPSEAYHEEETRTKLEKLVRTRERMIDGINFNAEREYEEQVKKHQFYQEQAEDLNKSLDSLQEAINKINRTSRERFRDTFQQVSENFRKILPLVFEGGKGELILTDEHDLLETGVEIMVQPSGKKLKNINLLSGGEKALSAISLLFSLYLFKPSPFCLLDEVDSPLDDANVHRFIKIIKRFSTDSQFILITHNKQTMETADTLYGVTMEEPGVSKIVSVRLN